MQRSSGSSNTRAAFEAVVVVVVWTPAVTAVVWGGNGCGPAMPAASFGSGSGRQCLWNTIMAVTATRSCVV